MQATRKGRPKVFVRADEFRSLVDPLNVVTIERQANNLGTDGGNLSRIYRGQPVSAEFIARVRLTYPDVPYERVFREAWA